MPYPPVPYPPIASLTTPATPPRIKANSSSLSEAVSSSHTTASASSPPLSTPIFQPFVFPRPSPITSRAPPPSPYSSKSLFFLQLERTRTIESPPSSSPSKQGRFGKFRPPKKSVKRDRDEGREDSEQEDIEVREVIERKKRRRLEASANDGEGNDAQDARIAISGDSSSPHQRSEHLEIDSLSPRSSSPSPSIAPTSNPIPHQIPFNHPRLINQNVSLRKKKKKEEETGKDEKAESSEDELMIALDQLIAGTKKRERKESNLGGRR